MRTNLKELKNFLEKELEKRVAQNEQYSKNSFARDLGISSTALNEYMSGKRELSFKNIDSIFKYLNSKIHCSWCDKGHGEVELMVGGPRSQYICKGCIDRCNEIVESQEKMG